MRMLIQSGSECVNISIIDDEEVESDEHVLLVLHTSDPAIMIDPQYANITIEDDDGDHDNMDGDVDGDDNGIV